MRQKKPKISSLFFSVPDKAQPHVSHPASGSHLQSGMLPALAIFIAISTSALAQSIFETRFNDTTDLKLQNGARLTVTGDGVSGQLGDKAYSADISTAPKASALITGGPGPISGVDEFTITVWYKPKAGQAGPVELFNAFGTLLIWEPDKNYWTLRVEARPLNPATKMYWFFTGKPPTGSWITPGEWTFIAMVWKKSDKAVSFYRGGKIDQVADIHVATRPDEVESLAEPQVPKRMIGNDPLRPERAFNGEIDDFRMFSKALEKDDLEKIRAADVKNEATSLP